MRQHILVVDDDQDLAESIADLLVETSSTKLITALAFNGRQAVLAATSAAPPDVIVMDIEMPIMDGFAAAEAIRHAMGQRAPHLIAVSSSPEHVRIAKAGGMFDHALQKPVDIEDLLGLLDEGSPERDG